MTATMVSDLFLELSTMENNTEEPNATDPPSSGGGGGGGSPFSYPLWLMPVIIGILIFVGVIGNSLVIYVIVRASKRTVTNFYIVNLAVADILFLAFCAPKTVEDYTASGFYFGEFMCKIILYMQYVTSHSTCCLLAAMSVDRFQAIVRPLKSLKTRTFQTAVIVSLVIWLSALLLYIPYPLYFEISYISWAGTVNPYCLIEWPNKTTPDVYKVLTFLFPYALPLIVIAVCYTAMLRHLWMRVGPSDDLSGPSNAAHAERNLRQKRKITWMVLTVVIVFAVCWFPTQYYSLWEYFGTNFQRTEAALNFRTAGVILSYANSCANPFIYAFLGENFRKSFRKAFHCCFKKAGRDRHGNGRAGATGGGAEGASSVAGPSTSRAGNTTQMTSLPSRTDAQIDP